jgi:hypothetical protein
MKNFVIEKRLHAEAHVNIIMTITKDYSKTKLACYLGFVTQAIVANFTPLLFIAFHHEYKRTAYFGLLLSNMFTGQQ